MDLRSYKEVSGSKFGFHFRATKRVANDRSQHLKMFGEVSKRLSAEMNEIWLINRTSGISKMIISPKRFEITLSIWYANSSGAQALSIGEGYGPLAGRIRK